MLRGNGAGAPVGRRTRRVRRTVAGTGVVPFIGSGAAVTVGCGSGAVMTNRPSTTSRRRRWTHRHPACPAAPLSSRTATVDKRAEMASIVPTRPGPKRSISSVLTSGVMLSAG